MDSPAWFLNVALLLAEVVYSQGKLGKIMSGLTLVEEPEDLLFLNTMPSKLSCVTEGYPTPRVIWLDEKGAIVKPSADLTSIVDGELIFHAFLTNQYDASVHDAQYRCKVVNTAGSIISRLVKAKAVLDQRYSPIVYHQSAPLGGSASFTCQLPASESHVRVLAWRVVYPDGVKSRIILSGMSIDGFHALSTGELILSHVETTHEKFTFACISQNALNNVTLTSSSARMFPNQPSPFQPRDVIKPQDVTIFAGETLNLNCYAMAYPRPSFRWYKDGGRLKFDNRVKSMTGGVIKIMRTTVQDQGTYKCVIDYNQRPQYGFEAKVLIKVPLTLTESPSQIETTTGKTATFSCQATGTTPAKLEWRKDGVLLRNNQHMSSTANTLSIKGATKNDEGMYQCVVRNQFEQVQASARLVVDAVLPSISSLSPSQIINSGSLVTLACKCTGQPLPEVTWYVDNLPVKELENVLSIVESKDTSNIITSMLTIRNTATKYSGTYKCVAENRVGKDSSDTAINVKGAPKIVRFPTKLKGITGRSLYLHCLGKGHPKVSHVWNKNGLPVLASDRIKFFNNGTMLIRQVREGDAAKYSCVVVNTHGRDQASVHLTVLDPPQITPFTLTPVLDGRRATYVCTSQGRSPTTITWYKDGIDAKEIKGVKIVELGFSKALTFSKVTTSHRGRYTCVMKNEAGEARHSADLVVYEKPSFVRVPKDVSTLDAYPIQLPCSATGFPLPQITWFKKTGLNHIKPVFLDHRIRQMHNGTLYIAVARASDNGKYVCQASFFDKDYVPDPISKEVLVQVKVPAKIITTSSLTARNTKSKSIQLFCSITGTPVLELKWFKNGVIMSDENNHKYDVTRKLEISEPPVMNSTITIKDLSRTDNGNYECKATNSYGSNKVLYKVFVEEAPYKPMAIAKVSSTSRSIKIKWKPGYSGNSPIRLYHVELKETSKKSWDFAKFYQIGNKTEAVIKNLVPGSSYTFRVNAMNEHGKSEWSDENVLKTKEEAPSAPPQRVSIQVIAKDKIYVKWKMPEERKRNGIIVKFRIFYVPMYRHDVKEQNVTIRYIQQYVLQNLLQFTTYKVQVQALTSVGAGPLSAPQVTTTLEGVPSEPPPSFEVQVISSQSMLVSWKPMAAVAVNGLLLGYRVSYTDVIRRQTYRKTFANAVGTQLTSLRKFTTYRVSVLAYTKIGDGVMSDYIVKTTDEDTPGKPSRFTLTPASPSQILVAWTPPINRNGVILEYTIYYKDSRKNEIIQVDGIPHDETSYKLKHLIMGRPYLVWMTATTSKGEGEKTKKIAAITQEHVPAQIVTRHGMVIKSPKGSNVELPCAAVGHPEPSIAWYKLIPTVGRKQKRWMVANVPKQLYNIKENDAGKYNCTAVNGYGSDWNVVTLFVQVVPASPNDLAANLAGPKDINVSWVPGFNGYSSIIAHHVNFMNDLHQTTWEKRILPPSQWWFVIRNVTNDTAFFQVASRNKVGLGIFSQPLRLVINGQNVGMFPTSMFKIAKRKQEHESLNKIMKPVLISIVALTTVVIFLLLIASWDRRERRIRKPKCYRLACHCSCGKKRDFISDPYGEPNLPWPWNVKSNRHSGAFDMHNELLGASEEHLEFKYAPNYDEANTNSLKKKFPNINGMDFEPVVLFTPKSPNLGNYSTQNNNFKSLTSNSQRNSGKHLENISRPNGQVDKPSIIEKYLRSQEENDCSAVYPNRDSILSEDSIYFECAPPPPPLHINPTSRGSADGKSTEYIIPLETGERFKHDTSLDDAPRVLLRGTSPGRRGKRGKNRKSLDSLILKALEDIEEKQVLSNDATLDKAALEQHRSNIIKELLANPPRHYDSVSSTCSSSVGELRRAFEFGKKHGLQDYQIPPYLMDTDYDDDVEDNELDYSAHEKLLNALDITNFSSMPRDMNDMKVKIPLPVRLSSDGDDEDDTNDDGLHLDMNTDFDLGEQSFV